jgi:peptidoglycan/LPS O-acetylase OafA/YrhL
MLTKHTVEPSGIAKPVKKQYFSNLDALRVIACGMVIIQHTLLKDTLAPLLDNSLYTRFLALLASGDLGVSFFFVLSGFLITYLLLGEVERTGRIHLGHFYMRRTLRIWPLYFAVVLFGFFLYPWMKSHMGIATELANRLPYQLLFLTNFDSIYMAHHGLEGKSVMMLNITWSVAIEEQFYLVWPLLFILTPKRFYRYIFHAVILGSLVFRIMHDKPTDYFHTLAVSSDLAMGGLAAWHIRNSPHVQRWVRNIPMWGITTAYVFGILSLLFRDVLFPGAAGYVWARLPFSLFFAFVLLEQSFATHSPFKLSNLRRMSSLGKYTYGLYLLHPIAIQVADLLCRALHISIATLPGGLLYFGVSVSVALMISILSYRYFESFFINLKHRFA